ncbi:GNAT family N-acetyltransferase [Echria macrotheca]|uniref:GNAT family N-acetyltransferase n=1 Tax=Echria macrotheca TaxID=438768 RepID=A0AAJ0BJZ4_9PEZI|nr:GNAT family N-acetyltransferase [Echria macrotheca]
MGIPSPELRTWTRTIGDTVYTCSTDPSHVAIDALSDAFTSDMLWWAKALPSDVLATVVQNSLCFAIYTNNNKPTSTTTQNDGDKPPTAMIAFGRLITDYVTFGYLTDVYVLPEHQGKGLGRWMMACLDEVLNSWPHLRRCVLFTRGAQNVKLYEQTLGMNSVAESTGDGLVVMQCAGQGAIKR